MSPETPAPDEGQYSGGELAKELLAEQQLAGLFEMARLRPEERTYPTIGLATPEQREALQYRQVEIPLSELLASPYVRRRLAELETSEKGNKPSRDIVRDIVASDFDQSKEDLPIYLHLAKHEDGSLDWELDGGRHRIAAAYLAGRESILANVTTKQGYIDSDDDRRKWAELEGRQVPKG